MEVSDVALPSINMGIDKYLSCIPQHQLSKSQKETMGIEDEIRT
jgi:hypothetical protein